MESGNDGEPSFSLQDFKKWMSGKRGAARECGAGDPVEPISRKFLNRMEVAEGDVYEMAREFRRVGGKISRVDGAYVLVEVAAGSFVIPRECVRRV